MPDNTPKGNRPKLKPWTKVLSGLCVIFVWGAAANLGIGLTSWYLGIPFLIALGVLLRRSGLWAILLAYLIALTPLGLVLSLDASLSRLHFPGIGTTISVPAGWGTATYERDPRPYLKSPEDLEFWATRKDGPATSVFSQPVSLKLVRVITRHPDLRQEYSAILEDPSGALLEMDETALLRAINAGQLTAPVLVGEHNLHRSVLRGLGNLMYWPVLPAALPAVFAPGGQ